MFKDEILQYPQAHLLKLAGFDEDCIYHYKVSRETGKHTQNTTFEIKDAFGRNHNILETRVSAPFYHQAFAWFRRKHNLYAYVGPIALLQDTGEFKYEITNFKTNWDEDQTLHSYEEAELACLRKLIDIVLNTEE